MDSASLFQCSISRGSFILFSFFFFQAEDGIRDRTVTGVQTCALPIYTLGFTVDAVLVAVFMVQMLQLHGSVLWSWLDAPVVRYLGVISYPLYLWHQWGLGAGLHVPAGRLGQFVAGIGVSILLASGSYYIIERPFLALKTRFAAPTEVPPAGRRAVESPA